MQERRNRNQLASDGHVRCELANILLIEDDETLRFTVSRALEKASHAVSSVDSIEAARGCLESSTFDLVLTDVHLGTDSGIEMPRPIFRRDVMRQVPCTRRVAKGST